MNSQSALCIVACLLLVLVIAGFYFYYGAFRHPFWASSFMILSACIPTIMVSGILPYDIALSMNTNENNTDLRLTITLEILYWVSFALTWIIVPFLVSYLSYSHTLSVKHRLFMVIRENLIIYGIAALLIFIALIIMIATKKLTIKTIPSMFVALSNGYGLVLLSLSYGFGFVAFPRYLWQSADPALKYKHKIDQLYKEINKCAHSVADADAALEHFRIAEENVEGDMATRFIALGKSRCDKLNLLKSALPIPDKFYTSQCTNKKINAVRKIDWKNCTETNIEDFLCLMDQTAESLDQCKNFIMAVSKQAEKALFAYKSAFSRKNISKIAKTGKRIFAVFIMIVVAICYWSEISLIPLKPQLNLFYHLSRMKISPSASQFFISFPIISFLYFIGGWTLVKARVGQFYRFIPHASNANTLNYWAILICRLGPTIGYHYMLQIGAKGTSFAKVMGVMDKVILIGDYWNYFSPILMILFSLFIGFDLWDKIKGFCCCCGEYAETFSIEEEKNLLLGEEVLRELSIDVNNWIEENPHLSVANINRQLNTEIDDI